MSEKPMRFGLICGALCFVSGSVSFTYGVHYSRQQIRIAAEAMAAQPTNSFSRCLTEMWEQTGELDADWKGSRKWVLQ